MCCPDGSTLLVNTLWRSTVAVAAVSLSGKVTRLSPPSTSMSVIATSATRLYTSGSSLAALPSVFALDLPSPGPDTAGAGVQASLPTPTSLGPEAQKSWKAAGNILQGLGLPEDAEELLQDISVSRRISGARRVLWHRCELALPTGRARGCPWTTTGHCMITVAHHC